jgi:hypothetical protein
MSRSTAARRRRDDGDAWRAAPWSVAVASELEDWQERGERLGAENARLKDELSEVEGWYRLLQADHATLQARMSQSSRRITELQAEANRLATENQGLQVLVSRSLPDAIGPAGERTGQGQRQGEREGEDSAMTRIFDWVRSAQRHKWATAAVVTIATLLARDPTIQDVLGSAVSRVRQGLGGNRVEDHTGAGSGFLRYAAMIHSREQLEHERRAYNAKEATLKGDALLEAQDRLRAAKARNLQARRAFLPELARQCEQARLPLPREAADALAALNTETAD